MSKYHKYLGVISAAAALIAVNAHAQETMYIGGFGGDVETAFREQIIPKFEAETGLRLVYVAGNSTDTLAKLQAQRDRPEISVALIDDGPMNTAVEFGLCTDHVAGPHTADLYPNAINPNGKSIGLGYGATGLVYNKEVFAQNGWEPPTSWNNLEDDRYAGRLVIPPISNGFGLLALVQAARMNGGSERDIDPGFEVFKRISPNVLAFEPSPGRIAELLQTGEAALGVWGTGRVRALVNQGAPVEFVYPEEGALVILTEVCAVEGAPHPEHAQAFVQYLLSPEVQTIVGEVFGWGPVNTKTEIDPAIADQIVYGPEKVHSLISVDYGFINPQRAEWTNRWNREIER